MRVLTSVSFAIILAGCSSSSFGTPPKSPATVSHNSIIGWKAYPIRSQPEYTIALGRDGDIYSTAGEAFVKTDTSGNQTVIQTSGVGIVGETMTPNPDGDIYDARTPENIAQVSQAGDVIYFPLPFQDQFGAMITGSDQNIWIIHAGGIGRMTTGGDYTEFGGGPFDVSGATMVRGPDKNIWVNTLAPKNVIIRVSVADGSQSIFRAPSSLRDLVQGTDGNIYARGSSGIFQVNMDGSTTLFPSSPPPSVRNFNGLVAGHGQIWWHHVVDRTTTVYGWSVKSHKVVSSITAPDEIYFWQFGSDRNLWTFRCCGEPAEVLQFTK